MENGNDVIVGGNDVAVAAAANDAETSSDLHLGRNDSVKELISAEQEKNGFDVNLSTEQQQEMTNNGLPDSQLTEDVAEKPEVECDVTKTEALGGSRSTTHVTENAEASTGMATTEIVSGAVEMRSWNDDETGATTSDVVEKVGQTGQSALSDQSVTTQEMISTQESFGAKPEEEELQDQRLSVSSCQSQRVSFVSSCQEGEIEGHSHTGSASLMAFDAAAAAAENDSLLASGGMDQQPETPIQPDPAKSESVTSPEPEMVIDSEEVPAQQAPAAFAMDEQKSTLSTSNAESEQHETRDQVDSQLAVQSSSSYQSAHGLNTATALVSEQLPTLDGSSSATEISGAAEQPMKIHLAEISSTPEPQNDVVELTSVAALSNTLASCSEEMMASAAAVKATHAGEEQLRFGATDSTSPDRRGWRDELSTVEVLRSSVPSQRSETEIGIRSTSKTDAEPCSFAFPDPPQHPYEPITAGDDATDDVFVEHSPQENDAMASQGILPPRAVTSSTESAAAGSSDASRQQQARGDELFLADTAPAPPQPRCEEEAIPAQPSTPRGPSHEAQVPPPTSEAAAAGATAPGQADDGELQAEKSCDEIRADELHFTRADSTVDKLKTSSSSSSSEPCPSTGDFSTATDAARQQLDEVPQPEPGRQRTSVQADRRQLSLLIPGQDSDLRANDNQLTTNSDNSPSAVAVSPQTPVNRLPVEKMAAPEIAKTVRQMFETGKVIGRHDVKKSPGGTDMAAESGVFENEPTTVVEGVVKGGDFPASDVDQVQPGTTKTLLSQWQTKSSEQFQAERRPVLLAEAEGCVVENEPSAPRPDVVRGTDDVEVDTELPSRGQAQLLRQQWSSMTESSNTPKSKDATATVLAEVAAAAERPSVLENEPSERRADVVHGTDDVEVDAELPSRGQAQLLRQQWSSMTESSNTPKSKDATATVLAEVAEAAERPTVLENEPSERRADVVSGNDGGDEVISMKKGYARDLAGFWSAPRGTNAADGGPRRPIELPRSADGDSAVKENEPRRLEGVVRADEPTEDEATVIEKGRAKTMASLWQNRPEERKPRQAFKLELDMKESYAGVYENDPTSLDGVVRSTDQTDDVMGQRGQARNIAERFKRVDADDEERRRRPRDMIVMDRAAGPSVLENEPAPCRPDVVRSDSAAELAAVERGTTRNLVASWKNKGSEQPSRQAAAPRMDLAADGGVFENEPDVRTDVVRSDEFEQDVIPVAQMRSTRAIWARKELGQDTPPARQAAAPRLDLAADGGVFENEPDVRTDVVRSDEFEPDVIPVAQMRSTRAIWARKELGQDTPPIRQVAAPRLDLAADGGVFENEPDVRTDVVRSDEFEPDVIPVAQLRSTRAIWARKELEKDQPTNYKQAARELVRFTPPRDVTPPRVVQDDFKSVQTITLSNSSSSSPRSTTQQHSPGGASSVSPDGVRGNVPPTMTSSTTVVLRSN